MCIKNSCIHRRAHEITLLKCRFSMLKLFNYPSFHKFNSITCSVALSTIYNLSIFKILSENDAWYITPNIHQIRLFPLVIFFLQLFALTDTHSTLSHERFSVKHTATTLWNTVIHPIPYCRAVFFIPPLIHTSLPDIPSLKLEIQLRTSTWESFGFLQDHPDISQASKILTFASKQSREKKNKSDF